MVPPAVRRIRREQRRFACRKRSGCGDEIGERCVWGRCKDTLVYARGGSLPDLGQMRGGIRSVLLTGASSSWEEGGGGRWRNLCYRHSRMSVRFEAWFATRDRATESSEGWRERGQGGSRFWVPGLLKRFGTREWLQGLGSWVAQGSRKVLLPCLVSWLLDPCAPAGGALGGRVQRRPSGWGVTTVSGGLRAGDGPRGDYSVH